MDQKLSSEHDQLFALAELLAILAVRHTWLIPLYEEMTGRAQRLENHGWKVRSGMTQNDKILKHMKKAGSITVREAMVEYSVQSLTRRIADLREAGHNIVSKVKYHPISGQKYVRYSLAK